MAIWCLGRPMTLEKTDLGASSPANPAFTIPSSLNEPTFEMIHRLLQDLNMTHQFHCRKQRYKKRIKLQF
jgi:hypothetical protein